ARGLGAMESNQRHISFRMKKRGMHWSELGAEAMVKIKQGILNGTLREAYLKHRSRSERKQRNLKQFIRMSQLLKQPVRPSVGVKHGSRKCTKRVSWNTRYLNLVRKNLTHTCKMSVLTMEFNLIYNKIILVFILW
ncbi:hypothetical protein P9232_11250, partial [Weizmannia sp. CD-2023]|nr:hypothetical protein [Weizmannia sp. CD-2023]